jgi:hypothetical protein
VIRKRHLLAVLAAFQHSSRAGKRAAVASLVLLVCCALDGCSMARRAAAPFFPEPDPLPVDRQDVSSLDDATIDRRVDFITERLDASQVHAAAWEYGWLAVNGGGMVVSSAFAATDDDSHDRAYDIIEAVKAAIGTVYQIALPMPGTEGGAPIVAMPSETHAEKIERLRAAESVLSDAAARARQRTSWPLHLGNVAINLVGGAILLGLDEPGLAARSFAIDTLGGEAQIWTQPWEPETDWEEYQHFVATGDTVPPAREVQWHIVPRVGGAAVQASF